MMSIAVFLVITIISCISGGADMQTNLPNEILDGCPSLESALYQVSVINSVTSLNGGCAYINYNSSGVIRQSFSLWFTSVENVGQRCNNQGIGYLNFYCLAKSPTEDTNEGRMKYIKLYDGAPNKTGNPDHRCALYKTGNKSATTFRMAVSENDSCKDLLNMLSHPKMKIPKSKNGSTLLFFNKTRVDKLETSTLKPTTLNLTSTKSTKSTLASTKSTLTSTTSTLTNTTTTESKNSIAKRHEKRGHILQHLGNRSNPIRSNRSTTVLNREKREQRHALSYIIGGDGGRGSVMFLYGSQSDMNKKDDTTNMVTTTEDKNRLRQSSEIKHMQ